MNSSKDNNSPAESVFGPQRDSLYIVLPITIIYSLIFISGLLGNTFTCLVIVRNKSMHTATNFYLFSLAISDLLLLVSGMPQEMYSIWSKWPYVFGQSFCVLRGLAAETSTNASVLTITLFTIERYLAICHPFVSHKMSKLSRATKHVMLLWVAALGLALPQALQFGIRHYKGVTMCLQTRVIIEHSFELSTFCFFFAPMILITVLYALIGLKLRESNVTKEQSRKDLEWSIRHSNKMTRKLSQSTRRVIKMLVAVVVAFFICWAPFHAQRLVAIYSTNEHHQAKYPILHLVYTLLTYTSGVFYYMSTCINPIFYHIMSNNFRDAFKNTVMHCCRPENRDTAKRCSYMAIASMRNPTSGGRANSGNSRRQDSINLYKMRRQHSAETNSPTVHVCYNGKSILSEPIHECRKKLIDQHNCDVNKENNERNDHLDNVKVVNHITCRSPTQLYSIHPSTPSEIITVTADVVVSEKNNIYLKDDPEEYHKEIQLRIIEREKEYG